MSVIATAIWMILPVYVANASAVLVGGGPPIDGGRLWNGKPILGRHKTWRGLLGGGAIGCCCGVVQAWVAPAWLPSFGGLPFALLPLLCLSFGAMFGDALGSLIKRRMGKSEGDPVRGLDQLDFLLGAWFLVGVCCPRWFLGNFTLPVMVFLLILTPGLHVLSNIIGHKLGVKHVPW